MRVSSSAPTRISLAGGGCDLPIFYEKHGGLVISLAINIRQEMIIETGIDAHTKSSIPEGSSQQFYRAIIKELGFKDSEVQIQAKFDGKIQSGLGTSASAAVALVAGLTRARGTNLDPEQTAELAWDIEVNREKMYGGKQDQYAAAFGGMNTFYFTEMGVLTCPWERQVAKELEEVLMLFHTGIIRSDTKIQEQFLTLSESQTIELEKIRTNAMTLIGGLESGDWKFVGHIISEGWEHKKKSNPKVTSPEIDKIYDTAMLSGAYGGKLCGSGGGGYIFFIVPPDKQDKVMMNLMSQGCFPVDFSVDYRGVSSRIL